MKDLLFENHDMCESHGGKGPTLPLTKAAAAGDIESVRKLLRGDDMQSAAPSREPVWNRRARMIRSGNRTVGAVHVSHRGEFTRGRDPTVGDQPGRSRRNDVHLDQGCL